MFKSTRILTIIETKILIFLFFLKKIFFYLLGKTGLVTRQYFPYVSSESDLQRYKAIPFRQNSVNNNDQHGSSSLSNVPSEYKSDRIKVSVCCADINKTKSNIFFLIQFVGQWIRKILSGFKTYTKYGRKGGTGNLFELVFLFFNSFVNEIKCQKDQLIIQSGIHKR